MLFDLLMSKLGLMTSATWQQLGITELGSYLYLVKQAKQNTKGPRSLVQSQQSYICSCYRFSRKCPGSPKPLLIQRYRRNLICVSSAQKPFLFFTCKGQNGIRILGAIKFQLLLPPKWCIFRYYNTCRANLVSFIQHLTLDVLEMWKSRS